RAPYVTRFEVVRDPLWNNIRLDPEALAVVDTPAVQRLRYVRQLGHAFLVYPGATHTRFEHALGAYHLARRVLDALEDAGAVRTGARRWRCTRKASRRSSRCCSPSTRCTATSTGTTRSAARPACSSGWCGAPSRAGASRPTPSRSPPTTG